MPELNTIPTIPPPPDNSGIAGNKKSDFIPPPPDNSGIENESIVKKGFSPYEGVNITIPPKPTTFWDEVANHVNAFGKEQTQDSSSATNVILDKMVRPIAEGIKEGGKDIASTIYHEGPSKGFISNTLTDLTGLGKIAFNAIPQAIAFTEATNALKTAGEQTPYTEQINKAIDYPFALAHHLADNIGLDLKQGSDVDKFVGLLDIVASGAAVHVGGKVAGMAVKGISDITDLIKQKTEGKLNKEQDKELGNYFEAIKKTSPADVVAAAKKQDTPQSLELANKIEIANADEAYAKLQPTDKQKNDMLYDFVKNNDVPTFKAKLQELKDNGQITDQDFEESQIRINSYEKYVDHLKDKNLDDNTQKEATHKAWQLENDDFNIRSIENDPTHTEDPMKQAELVNLRDARKVKVKELADILANKPKEIKSDEISKAKSEEITPKEFSYIKENLPKIKDELDAKLDRESTVEEGITEARRQFKELFPKEVKPPKIVERVDKLYEEALAGLSEKEKADFKKSTEETYPEAKNVPQEIEPVETKKETVKAEEPTVEVKKEEVKSEPIAVEKNELSTSFENVNVIPYDTVEKNKYKPDEQLKFNQGDYYEPVRIVGHPDLIKLIEIGSKRNKGKHKEVNTAYEAQLEKQLGMTSTEAYFKAKELAKKHRSKTVENIIEFSNKKESKAVTAKEQREYNETLIKEREQAERDILKEEHKPISEEKTFNSKFEQLIRDKNKTKTKDKPEGDAVTEEATFHLWDDVGYVEFKDGTRVNLATDSKTGGAVQMGKRLPKDGSKVVVEAKPATIERPFDRVNIHGFDKDGKPIRGMLRRTNMSSNILEKTGEKNNPGAYADPSKVGLSEKERQEIADKEAKEKPQQQKESDKPQQHLIDKVVEKLQKALPKLEVVYDDKIEGAGQLDADGKTIRINPFAAGTDTPIHEYGHALIDIYGGLANKLVKGAVDRLKATSLWAETKERYPELSDDMLAKEVLAEAIGREGKRIFEKESQQTWFKNFVDNFFYKMKKLLGLEKDGVKILAKQLLGGKELSREIVANREVQLQKLSQEDMFKQFADVYHKKSKIDKFKDRITDVLNIPRALMTALDMSAAFRQAVVFTLTHPVFATRAAREMFKQAFSQKAFNDWLIDIRNHPNYEIMKESGMYISDPHTSKLSAKEEHFMTNMAQKIPVIGSLIKGSERAYVAYLNKIRTDVFINAIENFKKQGLTFEKNKDVYTAMADFINNATGRGNLGKLEKSAQTLNTIFFSPRLIASRINMLNPMWYAKMPKEVRKEAIKTFAQFIGVGSSILALAAGAGAKVQLNPTSSDFGKIQIGNTRLDIWGGFQQWVRVISQIAAGKKIAASGKKIDLTKGRTSRLDVAGAFARGKLAPMPALALELLEGRKVTGEKLTVKNVALDNLIPLYIQDMQDAAKQEGGPAILSVGIPAFFGVGTQTYNTNKQ